MLRSDIGWNAATGTRFSFHQDSYQRVIVSASLFYVLVTWLGTLDVTNDGSSVNRHHRNQTVDDGEGHTKLQGDG